MFRPGQPIGLPCAFYQHSLIRTLFVLLEKVFLGSLQVLSSHLPNIPSKILSLVLLYYSSYKFNLRQKYGNYLVIKLYFVSNTDNVDI